MAVILGANVTLNELFQRLKKYKASGCSMDIHVTLMDKHGSKAHIDWGGISNDRPDAEPAQPSE